jgi:hypothetical protein
MKILTGMVLAAACLLCSGCLVLATVAAVGALATTTIKPDGKATGTTTTTTTRTTTGTTAETTDRVTPAAVSTPMEAAALTEDAAARLSRSGAVVVVDQSNGAVAELPWQDGMTLAAATAAGKNGGYKSATIFRHHRMMPADLRQTWTGDLALFGGDVVELHR